jgi:hypothetical protein
VFDDFSVLKITLFEGLRNLGFSILLSCFFMAHASEQKETSLKYLLKPERFDQNIMSVRNRKAIPGWIHYEPRTKHPLLKYFIIFLPPF